MNTEHIILSNLIHNEPYVRKTLPFITKEYFRSEEDAVVFEIINNYVTQYNSLPPTAAIKIELGNLSIDQNTFERCDALVDQLENVPINTQDINWLVDVTEKFCQDKAVYNAILKSIEIIDGKGELTKEAIPQILQSALGVSFDTDIGHDYLEQTDDRFDYYHLIQKKIAFNLEYFNLITRGGVSNKTLNVIMAGVGVGKSLFMCSCAAGNLLDGKNVLYISLELSEEEVSRRIDANLLDIPISELETVSKAVYNSKVNSLRVKNPGKLIVKEYPTASAGAAHFRHLLNELRLKKNFSPDIIYIDYLNICTSSRFRSGRTDMYNYIKSIAEELRGLAVEFDLPIVTATQVNRAGYSNSDFGMEDTSESWGLPATADLMFALITTDEFAEQGKILVKQLKNRYNDPDHYRRFFVDINKQFMRISDSYKPQEGLMPSSSDENNKDVDPRPNMRMFEEID